MSDILHDPIQIHDPAKDDDTIRIAVLADESGSMLGVSESTVNSINSYIDEQRTTEGSVLVSFYTFNSNNGVRNRFRSVNAKDSPKIFRNNDLFDQPDLDKNLIYAPSGGTPLYDAIASVINEETNGTPTLVVILTDGMENASKEYRTVESIQTLIKTQEEAGWTFVFLMAGLSRAQSEHYTSTIMGRDYAGATMTYQKGLEDVAFHSLTGASASWGTKAREIKTSGGLIGGLAAESKNFFDPAVRDIKKDEK